ncbi:MULTISPECIES: VRR-NUC domain-containing protein [Halomonas]|uniref:VRR-NUC domain-containing protein n=1 Tax=Halomonas TaxID=2745 RepID=UPI001C98BAF5|nr:MULTISPECIES: VRR-NUC domain-containing protein [Halomonas]MBY6207377.1 VRR-NUC domain-containing protein [Halomonas sp. DP3Y7-2]MBY6228186.1 VRR-NUC domain-containing protein [Halomonas sp. DP3Y7-1]MCA0916252.1 VRR-NUC domain-containing protein [Halomonas denitrificans]
MTPDLPQLPSDLRDDPFYYLRHFQYVLAWVSSRHGDLLAAPERDFIAQFGGLPEPAQALLVRMVSRKGELFRTSRLDYVEVGDLGLALEELAAAELIAADPVVSHVELMTQLRLAEARRVLVPRLPDHQLPASVSKTRLAQALADAQDQSADSQDRSADALDRSADASDRTADEEPSLLGPQRWSQWWPDSDDGLWRLTVMEVCDRLRLMFFGNLRQSWSDFVMAELGHMRYEQVALDPASRGFQQRQEVDTYLQLHHLRERLEQGEDVASVWADVPELPDDNAWLRSRRARLLLRLGQQAQRAGHDALALEAYALAGPGEARVKRLRLLERLGHDQQAMELAEQALESPQDEAEHQALERLVPRLRRRLGLPRQERAALADITLWQLSLPSRALNDSGCVERAVRDHLSEDGAPVFYVENHLIAGLFGLLCWDVIFTPLPGAFFHPFHRGPADLYRADFVSRRRERFDACLSALDDQAHVSQIRRRWEQKRGIANPFVHWEVLDATLLDVALECIDGADLRVFFTRMLEDLKANRAGWPDLIQFFPAAAEGEPRYRLIEIKAPGDRLQDNQKRWLEHFHRHGIAVSVCHVRWHDE